MILEILHDGAEALRKMSCPTLLTDEVKELVLNMEETMISANGIGLAAPQVGINLRVIIMRLNDGTTQELINPSIIWTSKDFVPFKEGCLSIPDHYIEVRRPDKIGVKFMDISSKYRKWKLKGLEARVVQHEIDHLDGVLMTDYE